jgi:hypothetical protein
MLNAVICVAIMLAPVAVLVTLDIFDRTRIRRSRRVHTPRRDRFNSIVWYM